MKKILYIIGFLACSMYSFSQEIKAYYSTDQIFDNREYFSTYAFGQTTFAGRFDLGACFQLDSSHRFFSGINYMYEYGGDLMGQVPQLDLYYEFRYSNFRMNLGSFPRLDRLSYPLYFLTDTLNYYRPNVEGAFFEYVNSWFEGAAFIDWTGKISEERRESFLLGWDLNLGWKNVYLNTGFIMYHHAHSLYRLDSMPIQDNGILQVLLGYTYDFGASDVSLGINAGILSSYNRFRPNDFVWGQGLITGIDLSYTILSIHGVYYVGDALNFAYGDPFYRSGNYGRVDVMIDPFRHKKIDSSIGWGFHFVKDEGLFHSQKLVLRILF